MISGSGVTYVAFHRLGRLASVLMVAGVVTGIAALFLDLPENVVAMIVGGGCGITATLALLNAPLIIKRLPGLRLDQTGILFGSRPLLGQRTTTFVPWTNIDEIYLFRVQSGVFITTYIGLQGPEGVIPMKQVIPTSVAKAIRHVPLDVVLASRPVFGWRLDRAAFTAAVAHSAPAIPVIDLSAAAAARTGLYHTSPGA